MNATRFALAFAAIVAASHEPVTAQTYPSQPIRMIVPFAAGAVNDILGRLAADHIKARTGQAVIVENRTGAGGNLGLAQVAAAAPDGYTIGMAGVTNFAVNPLIYRSMPFDPVKDLVPVAPLAETPLLVTVNAKLPIANFTEMIAYAKANPASTTYASSGTGTPAHILAEDMFAKAGVKVQHLSTRGGAPALQDLLAGTVQIMVASPGPMVDHVKAGTLRFLAVVSPERLPFLPDVPTTAEEGLPKSTLTGWWGVVAPAATPREIVRRLNQILNEMADDAAIRAKLTGFYMVPMKLDADAAAAQLAADLPKWAEVVKAAGIKAE